MKNRYKKISVTCCFTFEKIGIFKKITARFIDNKKNSTSFGMEIKIKTGPLVTLLRDSISNPDREKLVYVK